MPGVKVEESGPVLTIEDVSTKTDLRSKDAQLCVGVDVPGLPGPTGAEGPQGPPGAGVAPLSIQAAEDVAVGQVVILTPTTGLVELAQANAYVQSQVFGFVQTAALTGFAAGIQTIGSITLADWTAIIGAAGLTPGATYWLDTTTPGRMTPIAPTTSGMFSVRLGTASNNATFDIHIHRSIRKR